MTMRSKQWYTKVSQSPNSRVKSSIGIYSTQVEEISGPEDHQTRAGRAPHRWERLPSRRRDRIHSAPRAEHDGRFVTIGPLALFSTDTGDAWLLDSEDHPATRLARDGEPEDVHFEET